MSLWRRDGEARGTESLFVCRTVPRASVSNQYRRGVSRPVIVVPDEVVGGELPIAVHHPLENATGQLCPPGPLVQHEVQPPANVPQVFLQSRGAWIKATEDQSLVALELGDLNQPPLVAIQIGSVKLLVAWHADELAVQPVGPTVVGA